LRSGDPASASVAHVARVSDDRIDKALRRFSERVKRLRVERGLRLADVASITGFSEAYLYRVEEGDRTPSLAALLRLADAHGISPAELLEGSPEPARAAHHDAVAVWEGGEEEGEGKMWTTASPPVRFNRDSRLGNADPDALSSPEQQIGMALAGCFSMSLAQQLAAAGFDPRRIETAAQVTLGISSQGIAIRSIGLTAEADVSGITPARLEEFAQHTRKTCVIAKALAAVPVTLEMRPPPAPVDS
jgi:OsmC subfamily peroxiredoxin